MSGALYMLLVKRPKFRSLQSMLNTINSNERLHLLALAIFIHVEDARTLGGIRRGYRELELELVRIPKLPTIQPIILYRSGSGEEKEK